MAAETALSDNQLNRVMRIAEDAESEEHAEKMLKMGRAIEQAVLQSPEVQRLRDDSDKYQILRMAIPKIVANKVQEALGWISVDDRLPDAGMLVLVYSPPQPGDWPDSIRIEFDFIDPDSDGPIWHNHSEHYEHYSCVAKGGAGVEWTGPSASAPYTHWMPLLAPPSTPA